MASSSKRFVVGFVIVLLSFASVECDGDGEFLLFWLHLLAFHNRCHLSWIILELGIGV